MNGLKIKCCNVDGEWSDKQTDVLVYPGLWGKWREWRMCAPGTFAMGWDAKIESREATDDTGMTGIHMICDALTEELKNSYLDEVKWGEWVHELRIDLDSIENKILYCGAKVRFESDQGDFGDNTAMNGLQVGRCDQFIKELSGRWELRVTTPSGEPSLRYQIEN